MRKLHMILIFTMLVCFVGTAILLLQMPEQVPVHMNFAGEVDRIGNKFEYLVFPGIAAVTGVLFLILSKVESRKGEESNENLMLWCGIGVNALLTILGFYFMIKAVKYDTTGTKMSYDNMSKMTGILVGALLVVLGNIMPKARKNSTFGIRTTWSMASDSIWQKTQRFGGFTSVIAGFLLIILSLLLPGSWSGPTMLIVIGIFAVAGVLASRHYYQEEMR